MLILKSSEVMPCGVVWPGSPEVLLGVSHQGRAYAVEQLYKVGRTGAVAQMRERLDHPRVSNEVVIMVEEPSGYRLYSWVNGCQEVSYEQATAMVCEKMRQSPYLAVGDRRWGLRVFKKAFVGSEAVTWLADYLQITRPEAVAFGQLCIRHTHFRHVLGEQDFADEYYFYRFRQDGDPEGRV